MLELNLLFAPSMEDNIVKFKSLLFSIILSSLFITQVSAVELQDSQASNAASEEITTESSTDTEAEEMMDDPSIIPAPVAQLSDEEFEKFLQTQIYNIENGSETVPYYLYGLALSSSFSQEQLEQILDAGFLTQYVDDFKLRNFIHEDYQLPKGTKARHGELTNEEGGDWFDTDEEAQSNTGYVAEHNISDFQSEKTRDIFGALLNDDVVGNLYVCCPVDVADKLMPGNWVEVSYLSGEGLSVLFMNEDATHAQYTWRFPHIWYRGNQNLNLNVEFTDSSLKFDLGDTLPSGATLTLFTDKEPGTQFLLKTHDGNIVHTLTVDDDGFITVPDITQSGDYLLTTQAPEQTAINESEATNDTIQSNEVPVNIQKKAESNVVVIIVILALLAGGAIALTVAISNAIHSKSKSYR